MNTRRLRPGDGIREAFRSGLDQLHVLHDQLIDLETDIDVFESHRPDDEPELKALNGRVGSIRGKLAPLLKQLSGLGDSPVIQPEQVEKFQQLQAQVTELLDNVENDISQAYERLSKRHKYEIKEKERGGAANDMQQENLQPEDAEIRAIQQRGAEISYIADGVASLGLEGVDVQVKVAGLHEISQRCERVARHLGIQAVSDGMMSQAQLSRVLGVAPLTVGRWMKDYKQDDQQDQ